MSQPMNLVVYLARAGAGSRRSCDELVRSGAVSVNGETVTFPRQKIAPEDVVAVNGEPVEPRELRYLLVNKPRGVASTASDPHADRVIVDLVPNGRTLFPVGRLDVDTPALSCSPTTAHWPTTSCTRATACPRPTACACAARWGAAPWRRCAAA